jgi:hypothetical protein
MSSFHGLVILVGEAKKLNEIKLVNVVKKVVERKKFWPSDFTFTPAPLHRDIINFLNLMPDLASWAAGKFDNGVNIPHLVLAGDR